MRLSRFAAIVFLGVLLSLMSARSASAQLAQLFYNITSIETKVLPNAVRVTIQTDGDVKLGVDTDEIYGYPSARRSFRLRFAGARAKVPAFTDIGSYPVDSAVLSLSRDPLSSPYFEDGADPTQNGSGTPGIDLEIRFYVPVEVDNFSFNFNSGEQLEPLQASILVGPDHRSVIVTVITDRGEEYRNVERIRRSPSGLWKHHLRVTGDTDHLAIDSLHTPLSEVLAAISSATGLTLLAQADAADADVSLFLPERSADAALKSLVEGLGLTLASRPPEQGGGYLVGRAGALLPSTRLPLKYLSAQSARLLFPDFMLPYLHEDTERNVLTATGSPALLERLRNDIAVIDQAPVQVRVEATAYEISTPEAAAYALSGVVDSGRVAWSPGTGEITTTLESGQTRSIAANLQALVTKGRAHLAAHPYLTVVSGATGTLFFGQTRFLSVLENDFGSESGTILQVPVGTTLAVTPTTADSQSDILLDLHPQVTTIDSIDTGTGLPTISVRQTDSFLRMHPGDTVLVGGLETRTSERTRNGLGPFAAVPGIGDLVSSQSRTAATVSLLILVTARAVDSGPDTKAVANSGASVTAKDKGH